MANLVRLVACVAILVGLLGEVSLGLLLRRASHLWRLRCKPRGCDTGGFAARGTGGRVVPFGLT